MQVRWLKNSKNNRYFDFLRLNLNSSYFHDKNKNGVYIIWYSSPGTAKAIRVGQGNIGDRLREHKNNPQIMRYSKLGQLRVTWTIPDKLSLDGIEAYLYNRLRPLVGERKPGIKLISVNLP